MFGRIHQTLLRVVGGNSGTEPYLGTQQSGRNTKYPTDPKFSVYFESEFRNTIILGNHELQAQAASSASASDVGSPAPI